jgi:hypothetical protein
MTDTRKDGGPAFPTEPNTQKGFYQHHGMSLRDYIAIHVDPQIKIRDQYGVDEICDAMGIDRVTVFTEWSEVDPKATLQLTARLRYAFADIFIAERAKTHADRAT